MAPKTRRRKTVVTTRKVVEETVNVVVSDFLAATEEEEDTEKTEMISSFTEEHDNVEFLSQQRVKKTIPVEETPPPEAKQQHESPLASEQETWKTVPPEECPVSAPETIGKPETTPVSAPETTMEIRKPETTPPPAPKTPQHKDQQTEQALSDTIPEIAMDEHPGSEITQSETRDLPKKSKMAKTGARRKGHGSKGLEYKRYLLKVMKQVHPEMGISGMAMTVINNMMSDIFERLAQSAADVQRHAGMRTMSYREVETAVKLLFPGDLGRHAIAEASKALKNYITYEV